VDHFEPTRVPEGFENISETMKQHHFEILERLKKKYRIEEFPETEKRKFSGASAAKAYPIQGILKYHGLSDWENRIAFLPSVSMNNSAAYTVTYVEWNNEPGKDKIIINEKEVSGRARERVIQLLDTLREMFGSGSRATVISKNFAPKGKGLGTSASGSAALALAAIDAALGSEYSKNHRFVSVISRYVAGSGCRAATGGISLWLSYPGIESANSFSVRLDSGRFEKLSLITIPVESRLRIDGKPFTTEVAHRSAPKSPFFKEWMLMRKDKIFSLLEAVERCNWKTIGSLAETDTIHLHSVTMSSDGLVLWEPETLKVIRTVYELRESGVPVYFSVDTGPTVVLLTEKRFEDEVAESLGDCILSRIGGASEILDPNEALEVLDVRKTSR